MATKLKRQQFAITHRNRNWGNMLFSDRKKFQFKYPGSKVFRVRWIKQGAKGKSKAAVYQPNHAQCLNIYAGINKYGVTAVHVVAGSSKHKSSYTNQKGKEAKNITAQEYKDVLNKTLLPEGRRMFTTVGISGWVLQQDGDPTHKVAADVVQAWNQKHGSAVSLLEGWPPNSPDLNLIENVWAYVQAKVDAKGCSSFDEFKQEVLKQWAAVPKSLLVALYNSMPKRLAKVIEMGGDKTKY